MRIALAVGIVVVMSWSPAYAQERAPGSEARIAAGIVWHGAVFGDDSPRERGGLRPIVSAIYRARADRGSGFTFEATLEPMGVRNPHFDERLHSLHLLAGYEIGRTFAMRPALGVSLQFWSGSRAETAFGIAPVAGVAIGNPRRAEGVLRASFSHGIFSWMGGVQLPLIRR